MKLNFHSIILSIFIVLAGSVSLSAQERSTSTAFSEIVLGGNYVWNGSSGDLNEYWTTGGGAEGFIQTPFYAGDINISFAYLPFRGRDEYHADFNSYYINLGWKGNLYLTNSISLNMGAKIGSFIMSFDDETLTEFRTQESEIAAAAEAGLRYEFVSGININVSAEFLSVFTSKRMKLFNVHAGLSYSFSSPGWFRDLAE